MSNNPPEVVVGLTREQAEFLVKNCDANIGVALGLLQTLMGAREILPGERATAERLVSDMETFKAILATTKRGLDDR